MLILKKAKDIDQFIYQKRTSGVKIGFVPTMGALHAGHISLVQRCRADGLLSICSIYLNPTQFNDKSDLEKYPVSPESDIELLIKAGCDVLFMPDNDEVYPGGSALSATYEFGDLENVLEGASRPGHFKGVGQVVARLLSIVQPDKLYLGQKDYQQCLIITKLTTLTGMTNIEVVVCPTTRDADGLAMSSRNRRLSEPQRNIAGLLYQCLVSIQAKMGNTSFAVVKKECEDLLRAKGIEPEYVAIANAADLSPMTEYNSEVPTVALIAARIGKIRLIDNIKLVPLQQ